MIQRIRWLSSLLLFMPLGVPAQGREIAGVWVGTAESRPDSGLPVNLRLKIQYERDSLRVALSLPESHLIDLEIPSPYSDSAYARYEQGHLHVEFTPDIGLAILGRLGPREEERIVFDGDLKGGRIDGSLQITSYKSRIVLRRQTDDSRPEQNVHFFSNADSLRLGGKLILPSGRGPFPAAIFVTGSDPDFREAWQLEARALAAQGVASLLYDKRGVGESSGASHDLASWDDLAGDVEGAVAYLRSRAPTIDGARIGLIGQSQGTWIIAKVAARDPQIRFLVSISGSGISAAEQETYRTGALMKNDGFSQLDIERARAFQRQKFEVARTGLGWEALDSTMKKLRADSVKWFPGYGTGAAARSLALLRLYGVLQFNYDPTRDLKAVKAPVLNIMGENDAVFPPQLVVQRMRSALAAGGNRNYTAVILPATSHGMGIVQTYRGKGFRRAINPAFITTLASWVRAEAYGPLTAFVDVSVVPMTEPTVLPHKTVLTRDDRIERIVDAGRIKLPSGTRVIDGRRKFLMPGLIDMHIHVRDTTDFTLYVANGVTTVRVLRGAPRHLAWKAKLARDEMFGPSLYSSGPFTNLPEIATEADALRAALEQKATGYDFIKIHGGLPRDAYDTLVATGRRLGIRVVGHAPRNLPFDAVLAARQADVSHLEEFIYTYFGRKTDSAAEKRIPVLAHDLATRGIAVTTTLVAYDRIGRQVDSLEVLLAEPQNRFVAPGQRASWERENNDYVLRFSKTDVPVLRQRFLFQKKLLKAFVDSGVVIMLGTDAVGETWVPGWTAQEELGNFVSAGLSNYQALRAATVDPAKFLEGTPLFGVVQEGKRADLVLLAGNPLESISNTRLVEGTMIRGRWYSAGDLRERLARVDSANRNEERKVATLLSRGLLTAASAGCDQRQSISSDEQLLIDLRVTSETTRLAAGGATSEAQRVGDAIRSRCPSATVFDESKLNSAADRLRAQGKLAQAVIVYAFSEKQFPKSFLAPYFLGETLLAAGDTTRALAAYRRSVANDAQMMDAIQRIQQLTRTKPVSRE